MGGVTTFKSRENFGSLRSEVRLLPRARTYLHELEGGGCWSMNAQPLGAWQKAGLGSGPFANPPGMGERVRFRDALSFSTSNWLLPLLYSLTGFPRALKGGGGEKKKKKKKKN